MKANKLFKKLALSGVALGAVAVTLTATTYAWYTQNTEVSAGSVSGLTSTEADTGSIYISAATQYHSATEINSAGTAWTKYSNSVDLTKISMSGASENAADNTELLPVSYTAKTTVSDSASGTGVYLPLTGATGADKDTASYGSFAATNIIQYRLRLRTASAATDPTKIYISGLSLANTISDLPTTIGLVDAGGVQKDKEYAADLLKALKLTVDQYNYVGFDTDGSTPLSGANTQGYSSTPSRTNIYSLENYATLPDSTNMTAAEVDAIAYYNAALNTNFQDFSDPTNHPSMMSTYASLTTELNAAVPQGSATSTNHGLEFITIPTTGYVEVLFTFWLDGWDEYCFDCMRKQGFSCTMKFSSNETEAIILTNA